MRFIYTSCVQLLRVVFNLLMIKPCPQLPEPLFNTVTKTEIGRELHFWDGINYLSLGTFYSALIALRLQSVGKTLAFRNIITDLINFRRRST